MGNKLYPWHLAAARRLAVTWATMPLIFSEYYLRALGRALEDQGAANSPIFNP